MLEGKNQFETPKILSDAPLRDADKAHFHFDEFAITLARLIADKNTRTPLTIGVSGPWGSGKTTLLLRLKKMLDDTLSLEQDTQPARLAFVNEHENIEETYRVCRTVWFDAWKYAEEEALLVALIRVILNTMSKGSLGEKIWGKILDPQQPRYNVLATFLSMFKLNFGEIEVSIDLEKYKQETPFTTHTAFFDHFDDALETLIARWVHGRSDIDKIDEKQGVLVVFIDDLDRCLPAKAVQVLEAVKLFLDKMGCIFVLGADANVIQQAVASHYKDAGITGDSAKDYLEKVIQLRFELPPILDKAMKAYLVSEPGVDEAVQSNWETLVAGAEINPRKVKTFSNDLNLQWAMLKNMGEAEGVNRDDFTRWQVLLRAAPQKFVERIQELDDPEHRLKFITDALRWAGGEESLTATFQDYAASIHLRRVLRAIKTFSQQFDAVVLDAFVHLAAPAPQAMPEERVPEREARKQAPAVLTGTVETISFGEIEFIRIPAGKFVMGSRERKLLASEDEKPQVTLDLAYDYWISRYPVTNQQYARFVEAEQVKHEWIEDWHIKIDHPVVNVTWHEAVAYCRWLDENLRTKLPASAAIRLPTEAEWEKAARGEYGNIWPWGNNFNQSKCNSQESRKGNTTPVGAYSPAGDSPYGVADMAGNAWEWCQSLYQPYPYDAKDGRENASLPSHRVLRGGSFANDRSYVRCTYRRRRYPDYRHANHGFRLVVSPSDSGL